MGRKPLQVANEELVLALFSAGVLILEPKLHAEVVARNFRVESDYEHNAGLKLPADKTAVPVTRFSASESRADSAPRSIAGGCVGLSSFYALLHRKRPK